jgi:hypothetical protein
MYEKNKRKKFNIKIRPVRADEATDAERRLFEAVRFLLESGEDDQFEKK